MVQDADDWHHCLVRLTCPELSSKARAAAAWKPKPASDFLLLSAEIEFWRVRNAAFSSLYEQLNLPSVKKFLAVLEGGSADQNLLTSFKAQFNELKKVQPLLRALQSLSWVLQSGFANLQPVTARLTQQASAV